MCLRASHRFSPHLHCSPPSHADRTSDPQPGPSAKARPPAVQPSRTPVIRPFSQPRQDHPTAKPKWLGTQKPRLSSVQPPGRDTPTDADSGSGS
ncbi:hypothetical protein BO71DRAFT_403505, partial [Aspergillus ellipticus CBS 707.79]